MSDRLVDAAVQRLEALKAEAAELEHFLAMCRRFEEKLFAPKQEPYRIVRMGRQRFSDIVQPGSRKFGKAEILASASLNEIESAGRPLPLGELADRLLKNGVEIGGADQRANLSAHLNNSGVLVSIKGHGWWPKAEPYEPANYDPSMPETNEAAGPVATEEPAAPAPAENQHREGGAGGGI